MGGRLLVALCIASAVGVLGAPSTAHAHDDYPGIIQEHLDLTCPPPCTLCHVKPTGGQPIKSEQFSTYTAPHRGFGTFVQNLIATPGGPLDSKSLGTKLDALLGKCHWDGTHGDTSDPEPCDSDGDTVYDYVELSGSHDPDARGNGSDVSCPKYGCGGSSIGVLPRGASESTRAVVLTTAVAGVLVLLRRRRRRT